MDTATTMTADEINGAKERLLETLRDEEASHVAMVVTGPLRHSRLTIRSAQNCSRFRPTWVDRLGGLP